MNFEPQGVRSPPRQRPEILVVDDDPNDVELLRLALKCIAGPDPTIASNGQEATEIIQSLAGAEKACWPDIILCDLNMPVMNGFEFIKWLKTISPCPRIPLVVLTSSILETDIGASYDLGAAAYLVKPSGHQDLVSIVKGLVDFWHWVQSPAIKLDKGRAVASGNHGVARAA